MRRLTGLFALAALLGGCGDADDAAPGVAASAATASATATEPDLAACPKT